MKIRTIYVLLMVVWVSSCEKPPIETEKEPDGNTTSDPTGLLFTSDESGKFEIWQSEGEETKQITDDATKDNWWPRISPDHSTVLFYRSDLGRDANDYASATLWTLDLASGSEREILSNASQGWVYQGMADWSHDGTTIVCSALETEDGRWQLFTLNPDGSNVRRISLREDYDYLDPVFSPDDQYIYCAVVPSGESASSENFEIHRLDVFTGDEERMTYNNYRDQHPHVKPDGSAVVYESLIDPDYLTIGKWAIRELQIDAGTEATLFEDEHLNFYPRYTVDGESIYFVRLDITRFTMTVARFDFANRAGSLVFPTSYNTLNVNPY